MSWHIITAPCCGGERIVPCLRKMLAGETDMGKIFLSKYAVPLMIAVAIIIDLYGKMLDSRAILGFEHNLRNIACAAEWSCFSAAVILLWQQGAKISYTVIERLILIIAVGGVCSPADLVGMIYRDNKMKVSIEIHLVSSVFAVWLEVYLLSSTLGSVRCNRMACAVVLSAVAIVWLATALLMVVGAITLDLLPRRVFSTSRQIGILTA